jgi:antitoxin component of MazEF toxin-antitoxin module
MMELSIGKWGNSLALRLPAEVARMMRVTEGSKLSFELDPSSGRAVLAKPQIENDEFKRHLAAVRRHTSTIKTTPNSVRLMRDTDRY